MHDALHVVAGEESGDSVANALKPAVVILLDDVDDGALHEGQLVVLVLGVVVDGHHFRQETETLEDSGDLRVVPLGRATHLSQCSSWAPTADLRPRRGRCTASRRLPLLRNRQEAAAAEESRQTWGFLLEAEGEEEPGCLQLWNRQEVKNFETSKRSGAEESSCRIRIDGGGGVTTHQMINNRNSEL